MSETNGHAVSANVRFIHPKDYAVDSYAQGYRLVALIRCQPNHEREFRARLNLRRNTQVHAVYADVVK